MENHRQSIAVDTPWGINDNACTHHYALQGTAVNPLGTLTFFCGKMGAGKTTASRKISAEKNAVLISEDEWLAAHYPDQIDSFDDYLTLGAQIKPFIKAHVQTILKTGTHVVMDFPANTVGQRAWFNQLCQEIGGMHEMIYLDLSHAQCLLHIAQRRTEHPERAAFDNEAVFYHVTNFFEPPTSQEGLNVIHYTT